MTHASDAEGAIRIWVVRYNGWQPKSWEEVPVAAVAIEPAIDRLLDLETARLFIEGFNSAQLEYQDGLWAVGVAVRITSEVDLSPGAELDTVPLLRP